MFYLARVEKIPRGNAKYRGKHKVYPYLPQMIFDRLKRAKYMSIQKDKIEKINKLIECEPANAKLYVQRGNIYHYESGYTLEEIEHNGHTKEINGVTYNNGYAKAIDDYTEALKLDSNFAKAYCDRAAAYHVLNDNDKAIYGGI